jgi:hypothetical protein
MHRIIVVTALVVLGATPARAQLAVIDPGNLAQAVLIAQRTLREYEALVAQYQTLVRMSTGLGNMRRYRMPTVPGTDHSTDRWAYGRSWLQALNAGDPSGNAYRASTRRLDGPEIALRRLPPGARRAVEQAYATVEIADSVAQRGGHHVGVLRVYSRRLQEAIDALEGDVLSTDPRTREMTAVLDKVAAGGLIARRQDMAANQLLSHSVEQLLARGKRLRDTEAATMNMRLGALRSGRVAGTSVVKGAADDLRTWRQP